MIFDVTFCKVNKAKTERRKAPGLFFCKKILLLVITFDGKTLLLNCYDKLFFLLLIISVFQQNGLCEIPIIVSRGVKIPPYVERPPLSGNPLTKMEKN